MTENKKTKPWYKYKMVWFIIIIPMLTIVASIFTIYSAVSSSKSSVHESYFKEGLSPNELAPRERKAKTLKITANLERDENYIQVLFNKELPNENLSIKLQHPLLEDKDLYFLLTKSEKENRLFFVNTNFNSSKINWDIFIDSSKNGWRIKGRLLKNESNITLSPETNL